MKNQNILGDIISKSIKEAREEINEILKKLESNDVDLTSSIKDYQRLIELNRHVDTLFKKKNKEIISLTKKNKLK